MGVGGTDGNAAVIKGEDTGTSCKALTRFLWDTETIDVNSGYPSPQLPLSVSNCHTTNLRGFGLAALGLIDRYFRGEVPLKILEK